MDATIARTPRWPILVAMLLGLCLSGATTAAPPRDATLARIDALVRAEFYAPDVLRARNWPQSVTRADWALRRAHDPAARTTILADLLASLATSHTGYVAPDDPRHGDLAAIFEPVLRSPSRADACRVLPATPLRVDAIGVWWQRIDGAWFVGGVLDGGPAQQAGLLLGDEVLRVDGVAFAPVAAFAGKAGRAVELEVRRTRDGAPITLAVTPASVAPMAAYRDALRASMRVLHQDGRRIGYFRLWSGVGDGIVGAVHDAIRQLNSERVDAFIVDIRDGWGGAPAELAGIFDTRTPAVGTTLRDGTTVSYDGQIRDKPAVVLINAGVRSGKETFAYAVKKHRLAMLVGEPTAGAMLSGTVYCLPDGALLYLAVGTPTIDGEVLEGRPTVPDQRVPFDLRHAAGVDAPLEAAKRRLTRKSRGD